MSDPLSELGANLRAAAERGTPPPPEPAFTGFVEIRGPYVEEQVSTTIRYLSLDEMLDRLRRKLAAVPPGTHVRVDLISWDGA
jgi:hypothetical protein